MNPWRLINNKQYDSLLNTIHFTSLPVITTIIHPWRPPSPGLRGLRCPRAAGHGLPKHGAAGAVAAGAGERGHGAGDAERSIHRTVELSWDGGSWWLMVVTSD